MNKIEIIEDYFQSWVTKDFSKIDDYFDSDIIYREYYGPIYIGLNELHQWINTSKTRQTVIAWRIDDIFQSGANTFTVEWYFHAKEHTEYDFDGVSIIQFKHDKIISISEYQSKHETFRPYSTKEI